MKHIIFSLSLCALSPHAWAETTSNAEQYETLGNSYICRTGGPASEQEYLYYLEVCRQQSCPSVCPNGGRANGVLLTNGLYQINCDCN